MRKLMQIYPLGVCQWYEEDKHQLVVGMFDHENSWVVHAVTIISSVIIWIFKHNLNSLDCSLLNGCYESINNFKYHNIDTKF